MVSAGVMLHGGQAGVLHGGGRGRPLHLPQRDLAARRHQVALEGTRDGGDLRNRCELGQWDSIAAWAAGSVTFAVPPVVAKTIVLWPP